MAIARENVLEKRGVRMFSQEQNEPRETPEGMIKLAPYAYIRLWSCLRGEIEHRTQRRKQHERNNETERIRNKNNAVWNDRDRFTAVKHNRSSISICVQWADVGKQICRGVLGLLVSRLLETFCKKCHECME